MRVAKELDLSTLPISALISVSHFTPVTTAASVALVDLVNAELHRQGVIPATKYLPSDANLDAATVKQLADAFRPKDRQHSFFENVLKINDPHGTAAYKDGRKDCSEHVRADLKYIGMLSQMIVGFCDQTDEVSARIIARSVHTLAAFRARGYACLAQLSQGVSAV